MSSVHRDDAEGSAGKVKYLVILGLGVCIGL